MSWALRHLWTVGGMLSVALGAIGVFLPLLPTVPFMLLAAFCFARGSRVFHVWLLRHRRFGPPIRDWQRHGAISRSGKRAALIGIVLTFAISLLLGVPTHGLAIQAVSLGCVAVFILTRPDGPR